MSTTPGAIPDRPDAARRELDGPGAGQEVERHLRHPVHRVLRPGPAAQRTRRADVHHDPAGLLERVQGRLRQEHGREQIGAQLPTHGFAFQTVQGRESGDGRIVHENIETAEFLERRPDNEIRRVVVVDISDQNSNPVVPVRCFLQRRFTASDNEHMRTVVRESAGRGSADTRAAAGDDDRFPHLVRHHGLRSTGRC
ncbi:hypothetical protein RKD30_000174 [Streptomyces pristinaespiralis]